MLCGMSYRIVDTFTVEISDDKEMVEAFVQWLTEPHGVLTMAHRAHLAEQRLRGDFDHALSYTVSLPVRAKDAVRTWVTRYEYRKIFC